MIIHIKYTIYGGFSVHKDVRYTGHIMQEDPDVQIMKKKDPTVAKRGDKSKPPVTARILMKLGIVRTTKQSKILLGILTIIIFAFAFYFFAVAQERGSESWREQLRGVDASVMMRTG